MVRTITITALTLALGFTTAALTSKHSPQPTNTQTVIPCCGGDAPPPICPPRGPCAVNR